VASKTLVSVAAVSFGACLTVGALSGLAAGQHVISQKGREFKPNIVSISAGDSLVIVNDDGDLRHHVYIDSERLRFDSGDQEPGSRTPILFPAAGEFEVLCAIHPKMRLTVRVN
jgi:plastocyanin